MGYLSSHPQGWMTCYALTYIAADKVGEIRCMAANLAGKLGLTSSKADIVSILNNNSIGDWRIHAALGLAHLVDSDEFSTLLQASSLGSWDQKLVLEYHGFLSAMTEEKELAVNNLIRRSEHFLALLAFDFMLNQNKLSLFKQLGIVRGDDESVEVSNPYFESFFRMLGYKVSGNIDEFQLDKLPLI